MTILSAGYVVFDNNDTIHGMGAAADLAFADMRQSMANANIELISDDEDTSDKLGSWTRESGMKAIAASQALLDLVETRGGDCTWRKVGGVGCTREEEEAA